MRSATVFARIHGKCRRSFRPLQTFMTILAAPTRVFLLSPASCSGRRAEILLRPQATFDLANRVRMGQNVTLGEVFSFLSGLYFRGKLAYATRFGRAAETLPKALIITAGRGLLPPETAITARELLEFASIPISADEPRYRQPLERDVAHLASQLGGECQAILLGGIATTKYREVLVETLGNRLHFPIDFVGRGDMSRGGLMLRLCRRRPRTRIYAFGRCVLRGQRPNKLTPRGNRVPRLPSCDNG